MTGSEKRKETNMKYEHKSFAVSTQKLEAGELVKELDKGWELTAMAPHAMAPKDGVTYVVSYWVTLRKPKDK
jgi:hypothetical protein